LFSIKGSLPNDSLSKAVPYSGEGSSELVPVSFGILFFLLDTAIMKISVKKSATLFSECDFFSSFFLDVGIDTSP